MYFIAIKQTLRVYEIERKSISRNKINLEGVSCSIVDDSEKAFQWLGVPACEIYDVAQLLEDSLSFERQKKKKKKQKKERQRDFNQVYYRSPPKTKKKMPWEFSSDRLIVDMLDRSRHDLVTYYLNGGNKKYIGTFRSQAVEIIPGRGILFKPVKMSFKGKNGGIFEGSIGHIWMIDDRSFINMGIRVGDCVSFKALAYAYQRKNGSVDLGLKSPYCIKNLYSLT